MLPYCALGAILAHLGAAFGDIVSQITDNPPRPGKLPKTWQQLAPFSLKTCLISAITAPHNRSRHIDPFG
jgi:hypothetical protein